MKKWLLMPFLFISITSSAVQINQISAKDIIGEWVCAIQYPDLQIESLDKIEYTENGETFGWGMLSFNKNLLNYETKHSGKWELKDNILYEISTNYQTIPVHSEQTHKKLNQNNEFQQLEKSLYKNLTEGANSGKSIDLKIHKVDNEMMLFTQIMDKDNHYPGACKKEKKKKE